MNTHNANSQRKESTCDHGDLDESTDTGSLQDIGDYAYSLKTTNKKEENSQREEESSCHQRDLDESTDTGALQNIGPYDILSGRHKLAFNNVGNRRFRVTISLSLERYLLARTRQDKTVVIVSIVKLLRENGTRFLRWSKGQWDELNEKQTREKVGHALRDMTAARALVPVASNVPVLPAMATSMLTSTLMPISISINNDTLWATPRPPTLCCNSSRTSTIPRRVSTNEPFETEESPSLMLDSIDIIAGFPASLSSCSERSMASDISLGEDSLFNSLFESDLDESAVTGSPAAAPMA